MLAALERVMADACAARREFPAGRLVSLSKNSPLWGVL